MARILVIDDDPDTRDLLNQSLSSAGHEVLLAPDGRVGLALQRATNPDLVVTDLYMPDKDGLETIIELRRTAPRLPVIAMSGHRALKPLLSAAQKLGAVHTLQKPFLTDELLAAVASLLPPQA